MRDHPPPVTIQRHTAVRVVRMDFISAASASSSTTEAWTYQGDIKEMPRPPQMIALRNTRPSIARGSFEHSFADGLMLGYQRRLDKQRALVLINYGREAKRVRLRGVTGTTLAPLHPAGMASLRGPVITVAPRSVQVFDLR